MSYRAPLGEIAFALDHLTAASALPALPRFAEAGRETRDAVFAEAARLCAEVVAPVDAESDRTPARLENGRVRVAPGLVTAYGAIREGGWLGVAASPEFGGMGLPQTFAIVVNEMLSGACVSLANCILLTAGHIEALEAHADDALKARFLPKLVSGEWTGTMNLTEPQAGSDLSAIRCRAEPAADGSFRVTGQKIYITWGDHDAAENISHLVLARLPDAPEGVRGISLFLVPRIIPETGVANPVRCIGLEHKMGQHGAPCCVMAYEGATGWLVGAPNQGLQAMFTMMNNARLNVAMQGIGVGEAAFQAAMEHASARVQGRTPLGNGPIRDHADVRRMLMTMRVRLDAARAIAYACAVAGDMDKGGAADMGSGAGHGARAAFLTPIAKAFCTDVGCEVASLAQQVLGGAGYVEDYGVARHYRDVRIAPIYEGTNGIQAMDLVGRKLGDGGAAARALLDEIGADAALGPVLVPLRQATDWMLGTSPTDRQAGAVPYLRAWALALGASAHRRAAAADPSRAARAAFFMAREAVQIPALCAEATDGAASLYADGFERIAS